MDRMKPRIKNRSHIMSGFTSEQGTWKIYLSDPEDLEVDAEQFCSHSSISRNTEWGQQAHADLCVVVNCP